MTDPGSFVDLATLQRAALYQQIVGEIITIIHLSVLGLAGLLFVRWKERQQVKRAKARQGNTTKGCPLCGYHEGLSPPQQAD